MDTLYMDIPRVYTAFAEWVACIIYVILLKKRFSKIKTISWCIGALLCQILILVLTGEVAFVFWLPCMGIAVAGIYIFLYGTCKITISQALYCCTTAFLIAEFSASLGWQCVIYLQKFEINIKVIHILVLAFILAVIAFAAYFLEKTLFKNNFLNYLSSWEIISTLGLAVVTFSFSNINFLITDQVLSPSVQMEIFKMRTLVDLAGLAVLYAFQSRASRYIYEKEMDSIRMALRNQYEQYRIYQDNLEKLRIQRHDLKHHIELLRTEIDTEKQKKWLDTLEKKVNATEEIQPTGNQVVDGVLMAKMGLIKKYCIQFTYVIDGKILNFIHVTDVCTVLGNALDNAIESLILLNEKEKRLIHLVISERNHFVFIQIRNYCEETLKWDKSGKLQTTKPDKDSHGYGLKSIRYAVEKYNGTVTIEKKDNWFELCILIPMKEDVSCAK